MGNLFEALFGSFIAIQGTVLMLLALQVAVARAQRLKHRQETQVDDPFVIIICVIIVMYYLFATWLRYTGVRIGDPIWGSRLTTASNTIRITWISYYAAGELIRKDVFPRARAYLGKARDLLRRS